MIYYVIIELSNERENRSLKEDKEHERISMAGSKQK